MNPDGSVQLTGVAYAYNHAFYDIGWFGSPSHTFRLKKRLTEGSRYLARKNTSPVPSTC